MVVNVGDPVLAYHGLMIYDAKVLKIDNGRGVKGKCDAGAKKNKKMKKKGKDEAANDNQREDDDDDDEDACSSTQFYVHYQGWAKKWDEWVRHDRVLEATPANRLLQVQAKEDLVQAQKAARSRKKKTRTSSCRSETSSSVLTSPLKRLKRSVENEYEALPGSLHDPSWEDKPLSKQMSLQMPFSLKKQLVQDWKNVTQTPPKLVPLPRKPTVSQVRARAGRKGTCILGRSMRE